MDRGVQLMPKPASIAVRSVDQLIAELERNIDRDYRRIGWLLAIAAFGILLVLIGHILRRHGF